MFINKLLTDNNFLSIIKVNRNASYSHTYPLEAYSSSSLCSLLIIFLEVKNEII